MNNFQRSLDSVLTTIAERPGGLDLDAYRRRGLVLREDRSKVKPCKIHVTHEWLNMEATAFAKRGDEIARWVSVAARPHPFVGTTDQCKLCYGWYDDNRHL